MAARQRVGEALRYGRDRLAAPGSAVREDSPALDAQVLLADLLGVDRVALFAHPERLLAAAQWSAYKTRLHRRAAGEPVAYLTGRKEFMALDFRVDRRVLIPRPATEVLVERALALLPGAGAGLVAADVGTGSGAIAVSLAHLRPGLRVIATDRSLDALAVARANATRFAILSRCNAA